MFDSQRRSSGTRYTSTAAFLVLGLIFSPAVLVASRPFGYVALWLWLACTLLCLGFAWLNWTKYSDVTILSIATKPSRAK